MTDEDYQEIVRVTKRWAVPPDRWFFPGGMGVPIHVNDELESPRITEGSRVYIELNSADMADLRTRCREVAYNELVGVTT